AFEREAAVCQDPARVDQVGEPLALPQGADGQDAEWTRSTIGRREPGQVDAVVAYRDPVRGILSAHASEEVLVVPGTRDDEARRPDLVRQHGVVDVDVGGVPGEAPGDTGESCHDERRRCRM